MKLIRGAVGIIMAVILFVVSAGNTANVDLNILLLKAPLNIPQYLIIIGAVLFGFIFGAMMVWLNDLPLRWGQKKQIKRLEKEVQTLHTAIDKAETQAIDAL